MGPGDHPLGPRVDLWLVSCPEPGARPGAHPGAIPDELGVLDAAERKRAASSRRPADRALYVASHLALRTLLGACLRVPAREVVLVREPCPGCGGPHGRPAEPGTPPPLHFSLSHSHGLALIGVAAVPVGVDVQRVPGPGTVDVCAPSLHPAERAELDRLPPGARPGAFAQLWARKEAYLKGIGTGLSRPASADYLGADPGPGRPAGRSPTCPAPTVTPRRSPSSARCPRSRPYAAARALLLVPPHRLTFEHHGVLSWPTSPMSSRARDRGTWAWAVIRTTGGRS
ncbi:4'-phosphopantetheinyl transferase family protein [Streptomyces nogalater]